MGHILVVLLWVLYIPLPDHVNMTPQYHMNMMTGVVPEDIRLSLSLSLPRTAVARRIGSQEHTLDNLVKSDERLHTIKLGPAQAVTCLALWCGPRDILDLWLQLVWRSALRFAEIHQGDRVLSRMTPGRLEIHIVCLFVCSHDMCTRYRMRRLTIPEMLAKLLYV